MHHLKVLSFHDSKFIEIYDILKYNIIIEEERQQTIFDVILKSFPDDKKVTVIKEVRAALNLGLKEAKAMVEKAPVTLLSQTPKIDAEELQQKLVAVGAEIVLE